MKLYILRPVKDDKIWKPWYDKSFGFVVCAENPTEARKLAAEEAGSEVVTKWNHDYSEKTFELNPWLHAAHATCKELKPTKISKVIMKDFHAA